MNTAAAPTPSSGVQRVIGGLDFRHVGMAGVERGRGHRQHRHVDQSGDAEGDQHLAVGKADDAAAARRRVNAGMRPWVRLECR